MVNPDKNTMWVIFFTFFQAKLKQIQVLEVSLEQLTIMELRKFVNLDDAMQKELSLTGPTTIPKKDVICAGNPALRIQPKRFRCVKFFWSVMDPIGSMGLVYLPTFTWFL